MKDKFNRDLYKGDKAIRVSNSMHGARHYPVIIKDFTETKVVLGKRVRVNPENLILLSDIGLKFDNESNE